MGVLDALGGGLAGAGMGSTLGPIGTIGGGLLGLLGGIFGSKGKKQEYQNIQAPEQTALQKKLSEYMMGKIGTPQTQYQGGYNATFTPTQYEVMNKLRSKLGMGPMTIPGATKNMYGMNPQQGQLPQMPQQMQQFPGMGGGQQTQMPPGLAQMLQARMAQGGGGQQRFPGQRLPV